MKKIYVMAAFLGAGFFAFSQNQHLEVKDINTKEAKPKAMNNSFQKALGEEIWFENFDSIIEVNTSNSPYDTTIISSAGFWTINNDGVTGDEYGWSIGTTDYGWSPNEFGNNFTSQSGGSYAQVNNGDPTLTPGSQMIQKEYTLTSGSIDIDELSDGGEAILSFSQYGAMFYDHQYLAISTDGGASWTTAYDNDHKQIHSQTSDGIYNNPDIVEVDLTPYISANGSDVKLRFGWTSQFPQDTDPNAWVSYGWVIDDLRITKKSDYDLVFESADYEYTGAQYSQVPADQVSELTAYAIVKNQGIEDLTGVVLNLLADGTVVASSSPAPVVANATDSLGLTYMPDNSLGVQTYTYELEMNETDDNPSNNQIAKEFKLDVNEDTYAADKLDFGATAYEYKLNIELTTGPKQFLNAGVLYDIFADTELFGLDVRIEAGEGNEYSIGVEEATSSGWNFITESDVYVISPSDIGNVITVPFSSPISLNANTTYRVYFNGFGSEEVKLASAGTTSIPNQITLYDGSEYTYISNRYDIPVIRMNFDESLSVVDNEMSNLNVSQNYPNPFANETTVKFSLKEATDVSYNVVDLTGKVVTNVDEGTTLAGDHEITIDGSSFANGVYYLNIKAGESTITRKMIVNK